VTHLANSVFWVDAYCDLESLKPGMLIMLSVLDFFLSWESHQAQHSGNSANPFYYLQAETIQNITGDLSHDKSLVQKCLWFDTQPIPHAPVIFLVTSMPKRYFLVLFDFSEKKALILGWYRIQILDIISGHAEWGSYP
jgi:hypothetical protein